LRTCFGGGEGGLFPTKYLQVNFNNTEVLFPKFYMAPRSSSCLGRKTCFTALLSNWKTLLKGMVY